MSEQEKEPEEQLNAAASIQVEERVHSRWMNIRTAAGSGVPLGGLFAVAAASQVYTVVYKVPVNKLLTATLVMSIWNIFNNSILGTLQDNETLNRCFDKNKWGRRAPWLVTHIPAGVIFIFLVWYPVSVEPDFLLIWFIICVFFINWIFSALFIATASGIAELYPFKEERLRVDLWILFWAIAYSAFTVIAFGVALLEADGENDGSNITICDGTREEQDDFNLAVSERAKKATLGPVALLSLAFTLAFLSIKPMSEAKLKTEEAPGNLFVEVRDLFRKKAFRVFIWFTIIDGTESLIDLGFLIYYLSYVSALTGFERTVYLGAAPAIGYLIAVATGFLWVNLFSTKKLNPTRYTQAGLFCHALIRPLFIFTTDSALVFIVSFIFRTVFISPRPYWYTAVRGWVIDDDCQQNAGKRREGIIVGFGTTIRSVGLIVIQFLTIGMSSAGIDNTLPDGCPQDEYGILYLKLMYGVLGPVICLIEIGIIELFPIKGEMLEKLLEAQRAGMLIKSVVEAEIEVAAGAGQISL